MHSEKQRPVRTEMNIFVRFAVVIFICVSIVSSARILMKYNDYRERIDELELKKEKYAESIERINYELEQDFDDEYVEKIAKRKLNLCDPNEIIYYNSLN